MSNYKFLKALRIHTPFNWEGVLEIVQINVFAIINPNEHLNTSYDKLDSRNSEI